MSFSRYKNKKIINNNYKIYEKILERRGVKKISHLGTEIFSFDDSVEQYPFEFIEYIWNEGDRLYKLSNKYYNTIEFWWVIGLVNQKPTDSHFEVGDLVLIPDPLEEVLNFIGFEI